MSGLTVIDDEAMDKTTKRQMRSELTFDHKKTVAKLECNGGLSAVIHPARGA